jgi:hypothetical protein
VDVTETTGHALIHKELDKQLVQLEHRQKLLQLSQQQWFKQNVIVILPLMKTLMDLGIKMLILRIPSLQLETCKLHALVQDRLKKQAVISGLLLVRNKQHLLEVIVYVHQYLVSAMVNLKEETGENSQIPHAIVKKKVDVTVDLTRMTMTLVLTLLKTLNRKLMHKLIKL